MTYQRDRLQKLYKQLPEIKCKGLCSESCSFILVGDKEKKEISKRLGYDPFLTDQELADILTGESDKSSVCSLLKDGRCTIHAMRPLICRLFGLVKRMQCPFGCIPDRWVEDDEARKLLIKAG